MMIPLRCATRFHLSPWSVGVDNFLEKQLLFLKRDLSLQGIGEGACRAGFNTERFSLAEVAGHGLVRPGMDDRCTVRAGIDAGFAADAPSGIRDDSLGFRDPFPCLGGADVNARCARTVLAHDGQVDCYLTPFFDLDPGE